MTFSFDDFLKLLDLFGSLRVIQPGVVCEALKLKTRLRIDGVVNNERTISQHDSIRQLQRRKALFMIIVL